MTERKFTPPTIFPAEYVDGDGTKVVILGRTPAKDFPLAGYFPDGTLSNWTEGGHIFLGASCAQDLQDINKHRDGQCLEACLKKNEERQND